VLANARVLVVVVSSLLAFPKEARAGEGRPCTRLEGESPSLASHDRGTRLTFVRSELRAEADRAVVWGSVWAFTGGALAVGNFARLVIVTDSGDRVDAAVAASTSLLVPAALLVSSLRVIDDARKVEALATEAAPAPVSCSTLQRAEDLLVASAGDETWRVGWVGQAIAIGGNLAVTLVLGLGFDRWTSGALAGATGLALSELELFTQPTGAADALARYRRGQLVAPEPAARVRLAPFATGSAQGASLVVVF
jgi:hypothetical protein